MRNWSLTPDPQDVAVLLLPRFSNHCLANAVEPLRAVNELLMREAYRWSFVTLDGAGVESSSGLPVVPGCRLRDHPGGDLLLVLSSAGMRGFATPVTARALRAAARRFDGLAGMDTGAWLMAHAGLLDGVRATIHRDEFVAFSESFGEVEAVTDRFVREGRVMSCGGAMTAFELMLELIRRAHGEALALEVSAYFMHQSAAPAEERAHRHPVSTRVERGIALMSSYLETPLRIGEIAARLGTTQRSLTRAFRAELGAPPKTVYKRLRLSAARRYAQQSGYPIAEIALRCGYGNPAAMTRAFVAQYGHPPSAFRRAL